MKGVAIELVTADCTPIILYDKKNGIIDALRSWKGAYLDIIKNTIIRFKTSDNKIYTCVNPCIGEEL